MIRGSKWSRWSSVLAVMAVGVGVAKGFVAYEARAVAATVVGASEVRHVITHESERSVAEVRQEALIFKLDILQAQIQGLMELRIQEVGRQYRRGEKDDARLADGTMGE